MERSGRSIGNDTPSGLTVRDRLLDAAIELFDRDGYDATSVADVAALAGQAKSAFFYYFPTKPDCLRAIHSEFIEGEVERLQAAVHGVSDPAEQLRRIIGVMLDGVRVHNRHVRIFDEQWRAIGQTGFEEIRSKRDQIDAIMTTCIEDGIARGAFASGAPPHVAALAIIGMCGWAHRWYQKDGPMSSEEIADHWSAMVVDGLRPREGRGAAG